MSHPTLQCADETLLVVIDIQEKLLPHISDKEKVVANSCKLIRVAKELGGSVLLSEQYPQGLGKTVPEVMDAIDEYKAAGLELKQIEKTTFSCTGSDGFLDFIEASGKEQVVLFGIESHVCVLQTALELVEEGFMSYVVGDAVGSRVEENKNISLARMRQAGVIVTCTESVIFEMLGSARHERFKAVSQLIK